MKWNEMEDHADPTCLLKYQTIWPFYDKAGLVQVIKCNLIIIKLKISKRINLPLNTHSLRCKYFLLDGYHMIFFFFF